MPDINRLRQARAPHQVRLANRNIAVLMACHNRREETIRCLHGLQSQSDLRSFSLDIYLVDDGSTDGTADAVRALHPDVHLIQGDGTLYWTGAMRLAMQTASERKPDFYIWLNDDTQLYSDSIARLLNTFTTLAGDARVPPIVVGSLCDPYTGHLTYGGSRSASRWHPLRFSRIPPGDTPKPCDVFNGNLVLFHHATVDATGSLHPRLVHVAGDYDYGLRARKAGASAWIAPGYLGECSRNALSETWADPAARLSERYRRLVNIKGQPPVPRFVYYRAHGGPLWFVLYPLVYLRPLYVSLMLRLRRTVSRSQSGNKTI